MPNRIIKESICTSEEINLLDEQSETFFYRLLVNADDFGLLDARLPILKSKCYPLKSIDINRIQLMLGVLVSAKLIFLYQVAEKPFLQITSWEKHQQIRAKRAKFPLPNEGVAITCNQLLANVPVIQSNPIQSNTSEIFSEGDFETSKWMFEKILKLNPKNKPPKFNDWANEVRLMRERDKKSLPEIREMFAWAHSNDFWRKNILSPGKLREKWDMLAVQRNTSNEPRAAGGLL